MTHRRSTRPAFTLIELLVVISIISLLLSILLPSMVGARRTGMRVACMANLRSIASGMQEYANQNNDWIIGSPSGSGAYLLGESGAWGPAVQVWDFMGPLAHQWGMGLTIPSLGDADRVKKRFNELRASKAFLCPANRFLAPSFSGLDAGAGWMVSYNTDRIQLFMESADDDDPSQVPPIGGITIQPAGFDETLPHNWRPNVGRIGNPSNKVFCADGSRFATRTVAPDYDLSVDAKWGGSFADPGAYRTDASNTGTRSWDRTWAQPTATKTGIDARIYSYRHSTSEPPPGAKGNAYRMNLAFYDGHVETQGDLESSNPHQWLPQGTGLTTFSVWLDARMHFNLSPFITIGP